MTSSLEIPPSSTAGSSSPSTWPPDSDPTEHDSSASSPEEPATSTSSPPQPASGGSPAIQYEHRIFLTGPTRSGKSYAARALLLSAAAPRLVIDPTDSSLLGSIPGVVTFRDPARVPDAATVRFVPGDPGDLDAYDRLYGWAFEHFPRYVLCDEAAFVAPAQGRSSRWVRAVTIQGAKRMIGHVACHTRPREVDKNLIAQAQHVLVFGCVDPEDRKHLAGQMGIELAILEQGLAELGPLEFLWWRQLERRLIVCPKLD